MITILTILTILTIRMQVKNDELWCIINNILFPAQPLSLETIDSAGSFAYPGSVNDGLPLPHST